MLCAPMFDLMPCVRGFEHGLMLLAAMPGALLIDRWLGEPPMRWHPVVWMGRYLGWAGRRVQAIVQAPGVQDWKAFWLAALYWSVGAAAVVIAAWAMQTGLVGWAQGWATGWPGGALAVGATLLLALLLKPLLAWAMLQSEVLAVEAALGESLDAGRARLSWLVSRDTAELSATQVRESAIESLAENLNDSVIAPIFWFMLLGLPGAALYRFANTADAMWGYRGVYRGQNLEWAGKWAAYADDVLNWLPARLTGLALAAVGRVPLRRLPCQARQTPSPNSGWPMTALALALGVRLGKPGVYVLNAPGRAVQSADVMRARTLTAHALLAFVLIALATFGMTVIRIA